MTICLKHYIGDYVTKCNFLTYHVYFIHVFVFYGSSINRVTLFSIFVLQFVLHAYCHTFTFHVAPCWPKIGNTILLYINFNRYSCLFANRMNDPYNCL